jgi:hypothetical protein
MHRGNHRLSLQEVEANALYDKALKRYWFTSNKRGVLSAKVLE